jgi:hypothetical protein
MYSIIQKMDGSFLCECMIQDGTERWTESNIETAIQSMKRSAKVLNGSKIKKKDIEFLKEAPVVVIQRIPVNN